VTVTLASGAIADLMVKVFLSQKLMGTLMLVSGIKACTMVLVPSDFLITLPMRVSLKITACMAILHNILLTATSS
jgi:hypothetical protein